MQVISPPNLTEGAHVVVILGYRETQPKFHSTACRCRLSPDLLAEEQGLATTATKGKDPGARSVLPQGR